jgi:hypothetical protein
MLDKQRHTSRDARIGIIVGSVHKACTKHVARCIIVIDKNQLVLSLLQALHILLHQALVLSACCRLRRSSQCTRTGRSFGPSRSWTCWNELWLIGIACSECVADQHSFGLQPAEDR